MNNMQKTSSGFAIKNIILIESSFTRINNVIFKDAKTDININVNVSVEGSNIIVEETVDVLNKNNETEQMKARVKMVGIFEVIGESQLKDLNEFGRINGAAIIFPFIREHITNLSQKGGMGTIILPPVNFANTIMNDQSQN